MKYKVSVLGTVFPEVDMDNLELGEKQLLETEMGVRFDDDGKVIGGTASGATIGVIYIAWKRVEPSASLAKVRKLRNADFDVEEVEEAVPPADAGGEVVILEPAGTRQSPESTESSRGSSTVSG